MKNLIIGAGEIGRSLSRVLGAPVVDKHDKKEIVYFSPDQVEKIEADAIHICFPFSPEFESEVKRYQALYQPKHTVIHSTVPVGTSRRCGAIFSPVVGMHPNLADSLMTFTKFLAGEGASEVAHSFRRVGMKVYLCDKQEALELAKLSQTTFYALMVEYIKDLKRKCDANDLSFSEVYTLPSIDYNKGYEILERPEFKMPLLVPIQTPQGGHCTIPNCYLWDTVFTKLIIELNEGKNL